MKKYISKYFVIIIFSIITIGAITFSHNDAYASTTPVAKNGRLAVKGTNLVNSKGNKVQLKGVSTHGIAWFPEYVNEKAFKSLRDNWGANLVRLAMYTEEYGGYCNGGNRKTLEANIDKGVKAATKLGMYVIIDWHILSDGNPHTNKKAAISFFTKMAKKYKNNKNVIFEICNEPNGNVTWAKIKSYAGWSLSNKNETSALIKSSCKKTSGWKTSELTATGKWLRNMMLGK